MKRHGWLGLGIMIGAEILLYAGMRSVATWFTPIMWTGYIIFADALIAHRTGQSWLTTRRREFGFLAVLSVLSWLIFEAYNLKLKNWAYIGVPAEQWQFDLGIFWSFATITPAIFQTAGLLEAWWPVGSTDGRKGPQNPPPHPLYPFHPLTKKLTALALIGLAFVVIPAALPDRLAPYTFGFVWLGFIGLLEPINLRTGQPSLLQDWRERRAYLALAGEWVDLWLYLGSMERADARARGRGMVVYDAGADSQPDLRPALRQDARGRAARFPALCLGVLRALPLSALLAAARPLAASERVTRPRLSVLSVSPEGSAA